MKTDRVLFTILALAMSATFSSLSAQEPSPAATLSPAVAISDTGSHDLSQLVHMDAKEFLELLHRRDAAFDNLSMTVELSWTDEVNPAAETANRQFQMIKYGGRIDPGPPREFPAPYRQPHRAVYVLTTRGRETTCEGGTELETLLHPEFGWKIATLKWSNAGGTVRNDYKLGDDQRPLPTTGKQGADLGAYDSWRMHVLSACGMGIAQRVNSIMSRELAGGQILCSGTYTYGNGPVADGKLWLDEHLVVRRAEIRVTGSTAEDYVEVTTTDTFPVEGLPAIARSGRYRRLNLRNQTPDAAPKVTVLEDKQYVLKGIEHHLSDERYAQLVKFEVDPKAFVYELK